MNGTQPPPLPPPSPSPPQPPPPRKSGMPTWAIVLVAVGAAGVVMVFVVGMLAAIAVPNFVRAKQTAQTNLCINNLRQIDGAKNQWALENGKQPADTPTESDLVKYLPDQAMPVCVAGGVYTINAVGEPPTCSLAGHELPAENSQ